MGSYWKFLLGDTVSAELCFRVFNLEAKRELYGRTKEIGIARRQVRWNLRPELEIQCSRNRKEK